jgi:hypothetical protein
VPTFYSEVHQKARTFLHFFLFSIFAQNDPNSMYIKGLHKFSPKNTSDERRKFYVHKGTKTNPVYAIRKYAKRTLFTFKNSASKICKTNPIYSTNEHKSIYIKGLQKFSPQHTPNGPRVTSHGARKIQNKPNFKLTTHFNTGAILKIDKLSCLMYHNPT